MKSDFASFIMFFLFNIILCNALFLYSSNVEAGQVNTWIGCEFYVSTFDSTQNLFLLNMQSDRIPISVGQMAKDSERITRIKKAIYNLYKTRIVKNTRSYDVYDKYSHEFNELVPKSNFTIASSTIGTRITEKYGKNWSYLVVKIRTKGVEFPVLYEIKLFQGYNNFGYNNLSELINDIGYATPEGLDSAIISTLEELFPKVEEIIKFDASRPYMFQ